MRKSVWLFLSILPLVAMTLSPCALGQSQSLVDKGRSLNAPPSDEVRTLVKRGVELAEDDRLDEALAVLKKALSLSPYYLRAHIEYRNLKTNFLGHFDEIETEYQALLRREPDNPIYLIAIHYLSGGDFGRAPLAKVAEVAPEWAWGHYAKALLLSDKEPEKAVSELLKTIEKDPSASEAYYLLIRIQETKLKRVEDAIATAEKFAAQRDLHAKGILELWRLRLEKASKSEEASEALEAEVRRLADASTDVNVLISVRAAYTDLLKDRERARALEDKIRAIDPTWYPMRGWIFTRVVTNESGVPRYVTLANRQLAIYNKTREVAERLDPEEKVKGLEGLLALNPNPALKRMIYEEIFRIAVKENIVPTTVKYGEALHAIDPSDTNVFAKMALVLAKKRVDLKKGLRYARRAEKVTAEFRLAQRPPNTPADLFKRLFPERKQREAYEENRASALDALGWVLYQTGRYEEAESVLRQSVSIKRSTTRMSHLVEVLRKLGLKGEADRVSTETSKELAESVRRGFVNESLKDFQLESIDRSKLALSTLKGKVVLINFWATWCGPCREELPDLVRLHEKYKRRGFEVVAVSTDEDRKKVPQFVREYGLTFPVFYDTGMKDHFNVSSIPANVFIDREGKMRYRKAGFDEDSTRELEAVINELIK